MIPLLTQLRYLTLDVAVLRMHLNHSGMDADLEPSTPMIYERGMKAMNNRLEQQLKSHKESAPTRGKKKVLPVVDDSVVLIRLNAKTLVRAKRGYAAEKWLLEYPGAVVVHGNAGGQ